MDDISKILQYGVHFFEAVAFIYSLVYLKKYINTPAKVLPVYLGLVLLVESMGATMGYDQWMYNLLGIVEALVLAYVFYFSVEKKNSRYVILLALSVGILTILLDLTIYTGTIFYFLSMAFGFVSLGITVMCLVYILELVQTEKVIYPKKILLYWVVIGLLFFHVCNLPVTVLMNSSIKIGSNDALLFIQSIAAIAMYIFYTIGFIWSQKEESGY